MLLVHVRQHTMCSLGKHLPGKPLSQYRLQEYILVVEEKHCDATLQELIMLQVAPCVPRSIADAAPGPKADVGLGLVVDASVPLY